MPYRIYYVSRGSEQNKINPAVSAEQLLAVWQLTLLFEEAYSIDSYSVFGLNGVIVSPNQLGFTGDFSKWTFCHENRPQLSLPK